MKTNDERKIEMHFLIEDNALFKIIDSSFDKRIIDGFSFIEIEHSKYTTYQNDQISTFLMYYEENGYKVQKSYKGNHITRIEIQ